MVLKNYWWLLIWLLLFGGISFLFIPKREEIVFGKPCMRWGRVPAAILALPYVIWAGFRHNFGDTEVYRTAFIQTPDTLSSLSSYLDDNAKSRGFAVIRILFKVLIADSDVAFFLLIAAIQIFLLVRIYRKCSEDYWLSMYLFVGSVQYLSWVHNGMRQFLAVTIIFSALPLLIKRRYLLLSAVILLASQIHISALVFFPFIFLVNGKAWNLRTISVTVGVLLAVFFLDEVTGLISSSLEDTAYEIDFSLYQDDDGTNLFRVLFFAIPTIISFVFRDRIEAADDPLINACVNLSVVATAFYVFSMFSGGILFGRVPVYFCLSNYILIPWFIKEFFDRESGILVECGFIVLFTVFFYYQVGVTWSML